MSVKTTGTVKLRLDPKDPPKLTGKQKARLAPLGDSRIDFSDIPPTHGVNHGVKWTRPGLLVAGANKSQITLRIDADVLAYFRATGARYQSRINAVLRAYMVGQDSVDSGGVGRK